MKWNLKKNRHRESGEATIVEIFDCLEKELRLHEILSSGRYSRGRSEKLIFVDRNIKLRLVLIRDKFEKFKRKYLEVKENE